MNINNRPLSFNDEEVVPTHTVGAAFALASVLGLIVVSGVLLKPYEAREVVEGLHERMMMEKEYRELSRISYTGDKASFSRTEQVTFPESEAIPSPSRSIELPVNLSTKSYQQTDRAQSFDRDMKSDEYWNSLQASIVGVSTTHLGSTPVVIPPVMIGSAN